MTWGSEAACRELDPESFFPVPTTPRSEVVTVKRICAGCPEREPCLDYAIAHRVEGIWGGTDERQRAEFFPRVAAVNQNKNKTHCIRGHEFTEENTLVRPKGRTCRACERIRKRGEDAA